MNTKSTLQNNVKLVITSRITMILSSLIVAYPILFVLMTSLKTNQEFYDNIWMLPKNFQWANYAQAWVAGKIGSYFLNSIIVSVASVCLTVMVAILGGGMPLLKCIFPNQKPL